MKRIVYYFTIRFSFFSLILPIHICRPRVFPLRSAGVPTGWNGKSVDEWGLGSQDPAWLPSNALS